MDYPFGSVNAINKKCAAVLEGIQVLEMKVNFIITRNFVEGKKTAEYLNTVIKYIKVYFKL